MTILQVTASRFYGGPERQMLELATALKHRAETVFMSFSEDGLCDVFLDRAKEQGFRTVKLQSDTPNVLAAAKEFTAKAREFKADVVFCEGYKPDIVGLLASRRMTIPVASISRGWTKETWKVRIYEALDRLALRYLDHVVCVSQEQANRVHAAGVPAKQTTVIRNAVRAERFDHGTCDNVRQQLLDLFPSDTERPRLLVGSAGRLSPEKGFEVFVSAAKETLKSIPDAGFLIFGDGVLRSELQSQIDQLGLRHRVILAGFRDDLDHVIPNLDLFALSSYTEGLPNVVLEALAASVPVVATRVGGTPEVLEHGEQGLLVPSGDSKQLAAALTEVLGDDHKRQEMASQGRRHVDANFSFSAQADAYVRLIDQLKAKHG